ncbi:MAG TPA: efflux RND transporter permease subunit [Stenotrophobium sp.]|nr:efflux RND transporter permease subunit [Stenotrophobium sp.]
MKAWLEAHRRSVLFFAVLLTAGGIGAALHLPVALFPQIDFPRVVVSLDAGDRPVDRMVVEVTRPVEQALRGVPGVLNLRSTSSRGAAEVSVNFNWGTDMVAATLQVESAVNRVLPDLPPGVRFEARRMDPTIFPVLGLSLTSDQRDLVSLRDIAYYRLRPLLSAIPGVAQVAVLGGRQAEYQVLVDPARLQAQGLSVQEVTQALAANNVTVAVGRLEDRYRLYLTQADNRLRSADDIANTVLRAGPRGALRLSDVAQVRLSHMPQWTRVTAQGHDAVLINVRQSRGANTVALAAAIRKLLANYQSQLPQDVHITPYYDQSDLITAAASSVRDAILIGAVLAGIVLLVFLRSLRLMLVVALVLPAVLASTALLLDVFHMSFNMMTLGGMAAAVGLVVDDAVVMLEHIMRRQQERSQGQDAAAAPLAAAAEMIRPLAGSSLATVTVFVPLAFLSGVTGGFFKALALTMSATLVISFGFALFVVPLLADRLVRAADAAQAEHSGRWLAALQSRYARTLHGLLARPLWLLPIIVLTVIAGFLSYRQLGSGFMPHMDEGGFILDYLAAPGTSLTETDRLLRQVETIVRATPEVDSYSRRTGLQLGGGLTEANEGDFFIHLKSARSRNIEAVMADVRQRVETQVPGLQIETAQLMEDLIGDLTAVPQPIEVKLFGDDPAVLDATAPVVAAALGKIQGVVEVKDGLRIIGDAIDIRVDRVKAALEGLDPNAVTQQLETLVGGKVIGQIQSGEKLIGVRVWTPGNLRERIAALGQLRLSAPDGHSLPLSRVATIQIVSGQPQITRENLARMVAVTARLEGRDLGSAMAQVRTTVAALKLPASVRVEYGGLYAEQQSSFRGLALVFASALLLVMALLLFLYERWAVVISILSTVLLAVCGVFVGLWLTATELNISAMMGLTMIIGIVTEVAIFYFAELDPAHDVNPDLLVAAGRARLRPILMTVLIAILALMPLALGLGTGSAMQTPLAIAIISGLIVSVPLVLLVMPALYARFDST